MKLKWMREDELLRVDWPVVFEAPADHGGIESQTVSLRFEVISAEEAQQLISPSDQTLLRQLAQGTDADTSVGLIERVVVGWNETEIGVPFSPEALTKLIRFPFARNAVVKGYAQASQGRKAKN